MFSVIGGECRVPEMTLTRVLNWVAMISVSEQMSFLVTFSEADFSDRTLKSEMAVMEAGGFLSL